ncbi:hypothetical protein M378DRAFT_18646 [Amanita muscaria Koide BX008]|uniref:Uncharacterized protein n=1 Tax=Amanita muscaria (strain Koide BX008) TaxID=946122 RepID=A0A0C2RWM3_AMAMK|nr:hypothetical protein M378DRAFT_18646 [Amanita muscaria Koide BX008]
MTSFLDAFIQQEQHGDNDDSNPSNPEGDNRAGQDQDLNDDEEDSLEDQPPPSTQPRYRTTGTLSFMAPFSPRTVRTIKSFGKRTCTEMELPEDSLDEFTKLPNMLYMHIYVMAALKKYNRLDLTHENKKTLESHEFRNILSERLMTLLLSPQLTAYRKGLASHVIDFISKNKTLFKVPTGVYEDPEMRAIFSSLINRGINQGIPIVDLARLIAPTSIELTLAHMARIAFLRIVYRECMTALACMSTSTSALATAPAGNESNPIFEEGSSNSGSHESNIHPSKYWEVVDDRLLCMSKAAAASSNPNFISKCFTTALQEDMKEFPSPDKQPPVSSRVSGEEWQKIIEKGGCFEVDEE